MIGLETKDRRDVENAEVAQRVETAPVPERHVDLVNLPLTCQPQLSTDHTDRRQAAGNRKQETGGRRQEQEEGRIGPIGLIGLIGLIGHIDDYE